MLCFGCPPFGFSLLLLVSVLVLKGKPKENYWKTNPSRLRDLSGASFWASLASACSGAPSPGLPLSLSLLASSGLLWLALPPSFLSLSSFTRNKEEIRLWGLSGASVWGPLSFLFHALWREGERRIPSGLLWTCSGPLLSLFLLLSLLWGSLSGTFVWHPLGSSGWLWPFPLHLSLLLRVISEK